MYVLAKDKPFYYSLIILNFFLWYPLHNDKTYIYKKVFFFGLSAILRTITSLVGLGILLHLILTVKNDIDIDTSESIGNLTSFIGCMSICLCFAFKYSHWTKFFNNLIDFKEFGKPPMYDKTIKKNNIITLFSLSYTIPALIWYCFLSYIEVLECEELNTQKNLNETCGLIIPTWIPFTMEGKSFFLLFIFQIIGVFVYIPPALAICILPYEAIQILVLKLIHLKHLFKDVFETKNKNICLKKLKYCIQYHQEISKISKELSDLARWSSGNVLFTAAVVIGSLGCNTVKESVPKAGSFVMGYIVATFFVCFAGQRLIDESLDLTNYVYDSKWYEMDTKITKTLIFVLARSQKPLALVGPPFMGIAGHLLFSVMMKTAYSYLTLLNEVV